MAGMKSMGLFLIMVFIIPTISPVAATEWKSDGWIKNLIGPERLALGDEFGCHGYEGINTQEEIWVIDGCKDYLLSQTNSSRWGKNPISFGIMGENISNKTSNQLIESGFKVVGDALSQNIEGLLTVHRNGGSLEKNVANISLLESAEKNSLISIYWIARIYDIKVREDKDAIEWLTNNEDIWYTTWGEWYNHNISSNQITYTIDNNQVIVSSPSLDSYGSWKVPGSVKIYCSEELISVKNSVGSDVKMLNISDQHLKEGWRKSNNEIILSIMPGEVFTLTFESLDTDSVSSKPLKTFNDLNNGLTVVGHHVHNMRESASDFLESEILFTWLIERSSGEEFSWPIIAIAISTLIATPIAIKFLLLRDQKDIKSK